MLPDRAISRKRCNLDSTAGELFFSLVDYRNNLFTSNDPNDIMRFYDSFQSRDELIEWMKERPKGSTSIQEVEGDKNFIIVIPTADFNGKYAMECRDRIFKGLRIIFVESGEIPDPYFSLEHNCNVGIKKAMEYDPKWIIVSNDDIIKIEDVCVLTHQLMNLPSNEMCFLHLEPPGNYYSYWAYIGRPAFVRGLFYLWNRYLRLRIRLERKMKKKKFGLRYLTFGTNIPYRFLVKHEGKFRNVGAVLILSSSLVKAMGGMIYDENFINGTEDVDFSLRALDEKIPSYSINFRLGTYIGASLGKSASCRTLREIANLAYLNYKISAGIIHIPKNTRRRK